MAHTSGAGPAAPRRHTPGPEPAPHGPHHLLPPKRLALLVRARDQVQEVDEEEGDMVEEGARSVSAASRSMNRSVCFSARTTIYNSSSSAAGGRSAPAS
jgi:hypothetical protein